MKRVWVAQLKCANNHCIMAAAALCDSETADMLGVKVRAEFERMVDEQTINPYCGLCNSTVMHLDLRETAWETLKDAEGPLSESQEMQRVTAEFIRRGRN